jgi:hypothetical protein
MEIFRPAHWLIVLLMITPLMALLVVPTCASCTAPG